MNANTCHNHEKLENEQRPLFAKREAATQAHLAANEAALVVTDGFFFM